MAWHPGSHWLAFAEAEKDKYAKDSGNITLYQIPA